MKNLLISSEIEELERNYNEIMSRIRTEISGFINRNYWELAKEFIEKYGDLVDVRRVEKEGVGIVKFQIKLHKQHLYYVKGKMKSIYIEMLENEIQNKTETNQWGKICHTVTDSIEMDLDFDGLIYSNLFDRKFKYVLKN